MGAANAVAGVFGIGTSLIKAEQQKKEARDMALLSEQEAAFLDLQADQALRSAAKEESLLRIQGRQFKGEIAAQAGRGGVTLEGTPLALMEQTASDVEQEAHVIRERAAFSDFMTRMSATSLRNKAGAIRRAGDTAALGTILGGVASAGSRIPIGGSSGKSKGVGAEGARSWDKEARKTQQWTGQTLKGGTLA